MNRQKLLKHLENPHQIKSRHKPMLEEMVEQYPYATVLRVLLAKAGHESSEARYLLGNAALYTPNRSRLKSFMEQAQEEQPTLSLASAEPTLPAELAQAAGHPNQSVGEAREPETEWPAEASEAQKQDWVQENEEPTSNEALESSGDIEEEQPVQEVEAEPKNDIFQELQENLRRLRQQREKFDPNLERASSTEEETTEEIKPSTQGLNETLQQIVEEKPEQNLENNRVRQQRNLISSFLSKSERINRPSPASGDSPVQDLSAGSASTPPDLVTETLANIMVRQGKFERAIDIYEKLMLKYPQKNAYFAGRIEQLKNEL